MNHFFTNYTELQSNAFCKMLVRSLSSQISHVFSYHSSQAHFIWLKYAIFGTKNVITKWMVSRGQIFIFIILNRPVKNPWNKGLKLIFVLIFVSTKSISTVTKFTKK